MSFAKLLIHTCTIQSKSLSTSGYEQQETWSDVSTDVPCRHDFAAANTTDGDMRINRDDDLFFFLPDVTIERGNRIIEDGKNYDVLEVNKMYGAKVLHHLEVRARYVDTN